MPNQGLGIHGLGPMIPALKVLGIASHYSLPRKSKKDDRQHADEKPKRQVIEYLLKKGYTKTERQLRQESAHLDKDGRPVQERAEDFVGEQKYIRAFSLLKNWIEGNLDIYKVSSTLVCFSRWLISLCSMS